MSTPLTVIITGAGGGLGKLTATRFLESGANVAICDVHQQRIESTSKELTEAGYDGKFIATHTDVTDLAAVEQFVSAAIAKFGRLDVLINNAGMMDNYGGVAECTPEMWNRMISINATAPYYVSKTVVTQFLKQTTGEPGGIIINLCSTSSLNGFNAGAAYTASKHALLGLSKSMAFCYMDKGIYSIALIMGGMKTNVADAFKTDDLCREIMAKSRAAAPYDLEKSPVPVENAARLILFLCDREIARNANGGAINFRNNWPLM